MEPFRKNLHLTRQEAAMVFVLVVLLSGLMFSVGMWVGFSFSNANPELARLEGRPSEHGHAHDRAPASVEGATAKAEEREAPRAGDDLRKSFHESKQKALEDIIAENKHDSPETPKSVLDAEAHANTYSDADRKPASIESASGENAEVAKIEAQDALRKKAGPPAPVKALFERSPNAVSDFAPHPGSYTLQLASYATLDESVAMVRELRKAGFLDAYTHEIGFKNGEKWHRVAMGSYPNPVYARKMGERLRRRSLAKDFIVRKVED